MKALHNVVLPIALALGATAAQAELVVVVSAKTALNNLSKGQVSDLFLGKTATFPDGAQAVPIDLADGQTLRDEFHGKVTGKSGAQLKSYWSKLVFSGTAVPPKEVRNGAEVKTLVSANPNMIGYIEKGTVDASVKVILTP